MKIKQIRKYLGIIVIVLCMIMVLGGCRLNKNTVTSTNTLEQVQQEGLEDRSTNEQEETKQNEQYTLNILQGRVKDATMNTLTVETDSGEVYIFEKVREKLTVGETGVLIGNPVTITYYGLLKEEIMSEVQIERICVEDRVEVVEQEKELSYASRALEILDTMSLEEKVGQMFIARCPEVNAVQSISDYQLGGYIFFARDFKERSKDDLIRIIQDYQQAAKIKLFIGVDEEGGTVNRVSLFTEFRGAPFKSPQDLYAEGGWSSIKKDTEEKSELLKSIGINLNLAPVCDVSTDPSDYMFKRTFGKDAELTGEYVEQVVQTMCEMHMGSVLKHFPGYGNNIDTHTGMAQDTRSYETFQNSDFIPFIKGIQAGAGAVLVSHNIVTSMDAERPASLSPIVHQILREELGFEGVIMTDDLYMEAITEYAGEEEAAVLAVLAGNDMLCCTNFDKQIPAVLNAISEGRIAQEQIGASVLRILSWKLELGIIE